MKLSSTKKILIIVAITLFLCGMSLLLLPLNKNTDSIDYKTGMGYIYVYEGTYDDGYVGEVRTIELVPFEPIELPSVSRKGYNLTWGVEARTIDNSGGYWLNEDSINGNFITIDGWINYYYYKIHAVWTPINYSLVLHANDGSGRIDEGHGNLEYDEAYTWVSNYQWWKSGYEYTQKYAFMGWALSPKGEVVFRDGQEILNLTANDGDVVHLYGVWRETYMNSHYAKPSGSGAIDRPYLISNDRELAWISYYIIEIGDLSGYFRQTANIDLGAYEWVPAVDKDYYTDGNYFIGNYDGCGFTISNISCHGYDSSVGGLFGRIKEATIKNVNLISGEIGMNTLIHDSRTGAGGHPYDSMGSIVGMASDSKIINCTNRANIVIDHLGQLGGIVGEVFSCEIINCYNYGNLYGGNIQGGIACRAGSASGNIIKNCIAECDMRPVQYYEIGNPESFAWSINGIASLEMGTIENCIFIGKIYETKVKDYKEYFKYSAISSGKSIYTKNIHDCYIDVFIEALGEEEYTGIYAYSFKGNILKINNKKYYQSTDFSGWGLSLDNRPIQKELFWQAKVSPTLTEEKLKELGYTKISYV